MPWNCSCARNSDCVFGYLVPNAVLSKPHVVRVHMNQFRPQEVGNHRSIALAVDDNGLPRVIFEEVRTDVASNTKSTSNSDFIQMHCHLMNLMWIGLAPNSTILFIHVPIYLKMSFIAKDNLLTKIRVNFQRPKNLIKSCVNWIFYGSRSKSRRSIRQVKFCKDAYSPRGIDCLGFSSTSWRTAAIFSLERKFRCRVDVGCTFTEAESNLLAKIWCLLSPTIYFVTPLWLIFTDLRWCQIKIRTFVISHRGT